MAKSKKTILIIVTLYHKDTLLILAGAATFSGSWGSHQAYITAIHYKLFSPDISIKNLNLQLESTDAHGDRKSSGQM